MVLEPGQTAIGAITLSFAESAAGVFMTSGDSVVEVGSNVIIKDQSLHTVRNGFNNCVCILAFKDQSSGSGPNNH